MCSLVAYDVTDSVVVQVRPSLFCKQCFIHLYADVSSWELSIPIRQLFA